MRLELVDLVIMRSRAKQLEFSLGINSFTVKEKFLTWRRR